MGGLGINDWIDIGQAVFVLVTKLGPLVLGLFG
jgi:hypothetical protein